MGNSVVIPSFKNWYEEPIKKLGYQILRPIDAGTLFMDFKVFDSTKISHLLKAYEYNSILAENHLVQRAIGYFERLNQIKALPVLNTSIKINLNDNMAFITRPFYKQSFADAISYHQPPFLPIEKQWLAYQLLTGISKLHSYDLCHYDLKPNNVFLSKEYRIWIADPAPFKPPIVDPKRINLYYHYYKTGNDSGFYLAPERLMKNDGNPDDECGIDMKAADLFSLGCIIAYLYLNGEDLFDINTILEYKKGNIDLNRKLEKIEEENIKSLLFDLLSLDPNVRKNPMEHIIDYFPNNFDMVYKTFIVQEKAIAPVLYYRQLYFKIADESDLNTRYLIYTILRGQMTNAKSSAEMIEYIHFLYDFTREFDEFNQITRVITSIIQFFKAKHNFVSVVHREALASLMMMLNDLREIPEEFNGLMKFYLQPKILTLCSPKSHINDQISVAEILPLFTIQAKRLEPSSLSSIPITFSGIFTTDNVQVFSSFSGSLIKLNKKDAFDVLSLFFFFILNGFNQPKIEFSKEIFRILQYCYDEGDKENHDQFQEYSNKSIIPIIQDLLQRDKDRPLIILVLSFLEWMTSHNLIDQSYGYDMFIRCKRLAELKEQDYSYYLPKIVNYFAPTLGIENILHFIADFSNITEFKDRVTISMGRTKSTCISYQKTEHCKSHFPQNVNPRSISSTRLFQNKITNIMLTTLPSFIIVTERNNVNYVTLPSAQVNKPFAVISKVIEMENVITASCSLHANKNYSLGYENGTIDLFEYSTCKKIRTYQDDDTCIKSLVPLSSTSMLAAHVNGQIFIYDSRCETYQNKVKYTTSNITCACNWTHNISLTGIGFEEGLVSIYDCRIMLPVYTARTVLPKQIIPVTHHEAPLAFMVNNGDAVQCYSELNKEEIGTILGSKLFATPYKKRAVVLDTATSNFFDTENFTRYYRTYDHDYYIRDIEITTRFNKRRPFRVDLSIGLENGPSLHNHFNRISCVAHYHNEFISADDAGFLNTWEICQRKRV